MICGGCPVIDRFPSDLRRHNPLALRVAQANLNARRNDPYDLHDFNSGSLGPQCTQPRGSTMAWRRLYSSPSSPILCQYLASIILRRSSQAPAAVASEYTDTRRMHCWTRSEGHALKEYIPRSVRCV